MKNLKHKILQEFLNSDIKIISQEKLEQYIEYCIYNNKINNIKYETSHHHILPNALFGKYKDLKENSWNGTHLLYSDHYYAHWLLTEAIDDYGQLSAFCAMHNKDMKLGKINETDLIPLKEFQEKMKERNKMLSEERSKIMSDGRTKASHTREKQYKAQLLDIDENGLNAAQRAAIKYHENLKNTIDKETGLTKAELRVKRQKETIALNGSHSGKNNSAYGFRWIYNEDLKESKRVPEKDLKFYFDSGWVRGMKREYCKNKRT